LGSLTLRSFNLESTPATITVKASYSKHRRRDVQILHPDIVQRFKEWLPKRNPKDADEILFPVSARTCGTTRCTADMIQFDLAAAHRFWVAETDDPAEQEARRKSEFLAYKNKADQFADFHGLRHTFITNLRDAGVDPKVAQKLARHSDIRLTMDIYFYCVISP
jgi:integrase